TMLANRLGITRVIPTDAIREVMRSMFSEELMPTLHTSSFDAARLVRNPLPRRTDPVIIGGAHVVPGFLDRARFDGKAVVVPLVVTVDDEELHRSHFVFRADEVRSRPSERYLDFFENIRKLQKYVKSLALEHEVPVVPSYNLDATLSRVIELVVNQAIAAIPVSPTTTRSKRGSA